MSHTQRIYNRERFRYRYCGIFWHPYKQCCMGRCSWCRDPDKEPRVLRKRRTMTFRHDTLLEARYGA